MCLITQPCRGAALYASLLDCIFLFPLSSCCGTAKYKRELISLTENIGVCNLLPRQRHHLPKLSGVYLTCVNTSHTDSLLMFAACVNNQMLTLTLT